MKPAAQWIFIYLTKYKSSSVTLKNWFEDFFFSLIVNMNKTFSKSYIIPPLERTSDNIMLNYCSLDTTCFTYAEDNFITSHQLAWQKANCSQNHCITEPMSRNNVSISTVRRILCEAGLYGRIAVKKPMLKKQNNIKRLRWANVHTDWTIQLWNKVLWSDKSTCEIFGLNRRVYVQRSVGEKTATSCITPAIKYGRGSDRLSQHTAASRNSIGNAVACGSRIWTYARLWRKEN